MKTITKTAATCLLLLAAAFSPLQASSNPISTVVETLASDHLPGKDLINITISFRTTQGKLICLSIGLEKSAANFIGTEALQNLMAGTRVLRRSRADRLGNTNHGFVFDFPEALEGAVINVGRAYSGFTDNGKRLFTLVGNYEIRNGRAWVPLQ